MQVLEQTGLRDRKKRETRRKLALAAQELVRERGLEQVTAEHIATAAGVSLRTFFNYFSCKEEAVVGTDPDMLVELVAELRGRPVDELPSLSLRAVLLADIDAEGMAKRWSVRHELVRRHPALFPRYLAGIVDLEDVLADALADRMGVDVDLDPAPRALTSAAMAVIRSTLRWWSELGDRKVSLPDALDRGFAALGENPWR